MAAYAKPLVCDWSPHAVSGADDDGQGLGSAWEVLEKQNECTSLVGVRDHLGYRLLELKGKQPGSVLWSVAAKWNVADAGSIVRRTL